MRPPVIVSLIVLLLSVSPGEANRPAPGSPQLWMKHEIVFESSSQYENPLYDVDRFRVRFTSPSGRTSGTRGFWDGGNIWKVRFAPDEIGEWSYETESSRVSDTGLHNRKGHFRVEPNESPHELFQRGPLVRQPGRYYLTYADGTPFFWTADTAWNGGLLSTNQEWDLYLRNRSKKGFNVIQLVTTQWRGAKADRLGQVAFTGSGRIQVNPDYFKRLDRKIDMVNEKGLVAAPVLLWTLQFGAGRHLSPGYYLPENEATLLARYMVARYGGNQVVWILGGDGRYVDEYEQRWKNIGRGVFGDDHPGIVAQHPHGRSWIGTAYSEEDWLDVIGYQSSHSNRQPTVEWITRGPAAQNWHRLAPRPIINLEPIYEEILEEMTVRDVRSACYWSVFATPPAGITYGANGIWPWLREGEPILNHSDAPWTSPWDKSLDLPGASQVGHLASFMRHLPWWRLAPAQGLLVSQPGDREFREFVSVLATDQRDLILAYVPFTGPLEFHNSRLRRYSVRWFHPVENRHKQEGSVQGPVLKLEAPDPSDMVLILEGLSK